MAMAFKDFMGGGVDAHDDWNLDTYLTQKIPFYIFLKKKYSTVAMTII